MDEESKCGVGVLEQPMDIDPDDVSARDHVDPIVGIDGQESSADQGDLLSPCQIKTEIDDKSVLADLIAQQMASEVLAEGSLNERMQILPVKEEPTVKEEVFDVKAVKQEMPEADYKLSARVTVDLVPFQFADYDSKVKVEKALGGIRGIFKDQNDESENLIIPDFAREVEQQERSIKELELLPSTALISREICGKRIVDSHSSKERKSYRAKSKIKIKISKKTRGKQACSSLDEQINETSSNKMASSVEDNETCNISKNMETEKKIEGEMGEVRRKVDGSTDKTTEADGVSGVGSWSDEDDDRDDAETEPSNSCCDSALCHCERCQQKYFKSEAIGSKLKYHVKKAHKKSKIIQQPQTCDLCFKVLLNLRNLRQHVKRTHNSEQFKCGHCSKLYTRKDSLFSHINSSHLDIYTKSTDSQSVHGFDDKERSLQGLVGNGLWDVGSWSDDDHDRDDAETEPSNSCCDSVLCQCEHCRQKYHKSETKDKPMQTKTHCCDVCNKKFSRSNELKYHKESKCGTLKLFSCDYCSKGFTSKFYLTQHIQVKHENNKGDISSLTCKICQQVFAFKGSLRSHIKNMHEEKSEPELPQTCDFCQKVFPNKIRLRKHQLRLHREDTVTCGHCNEVFRYKTLLESHIKKKHMKSVLEETEKSSFTVTERKKNYLCHFCDKKFKDKQRIDDHLRTHTGEKPYVCDVCGKSFRSQWNLCQHFRTHSDKRPFSCVLCDKSFRIKHHLRQHMAVHGMPNISMRKKGPV